MKALKVMLRDGRILAFRAKQDTIAAAQMVEMSEEEYARYDSSDKGEARDYFVNESGARA